MPNPYFSFKQFTVYHNRTAMKVTTDACLFGAWCAEEIRTGNQEIKTLMDIGAGTGLLSLMAAQKNKLDIDAVEIDKEAAAQAKENITASPWKECIKILHADVLHLSSSTVYDAIISNPPFYENELESGKEQKNLAHHGHGLTLRQLLAVIKSRLTDEGTFFLLFPYKRMQELENELEKENFSVEKKVMVQQSTRHQPFRIMIKGSRRVQRSESFHISITNEEREYTESFKTLLKDYYLHL